MLETLSNKFTEWIKEVFGKMIEKFKKAFNSLKNFLDKFDFSKVTHGSLNRFTHCKDKRVKRRYVKLIIKEEEVEYGSCN